MSRRPAKTSAIRLIVYGTDTGVGKTVVTAALATAALAQALPVRVLKPVQTGAPGDYDGATVDTLVGVAVSRTGWRLGLALAPAVAARLERRRLRADSVLAWTRRNTGAAGLTVVETAGGCAVQIATGYDMAALGADLGFQGVVVCRPGLGTLNHTLLTLEHLRRRRAPVLGLVVNGMPSRPGIAETTNIAELTRLTGLPVIAVLPRFNFRRGRPSQAFVNAATELAPLLRPQPLQPRS